MNYMSVFAKHSNDDDSSFDVYWQTKFGQKGVVHTKVPNKKYDISRIAIAELAVAHKLILSEKQFARSYVGDGLVLLLGQIEAINAINNSSLNTIGLTKMFRMRFKGSKFLLCDDDKWIDEWETVSEEAMSLDVPEKDCVDTPVLGKVDVSEHAFERFIERVVSKLETNGEVKKPIKTLWKRIGSEKLHKADIPENVMLQKKLKEYKYSDIGEVYKDGNTNYYYVLGKPDSNNVRTLITVFVR